MASLFTRFLYHTQRQTTVGRTPLDEVMRPLPDKIQHSQQTNIMPPVGFESTISAGERPQTYALDRAATGTDIYNYIPKKKVNIYLPSLMIELPDHVYVLGDTYTCHAFCCYAYFFTRIGCTLLTCDMYMCRLRHIHDPILLSLKMEGIRLLFNMSLYDLFYVLYINCSSSGGISDTCSTRCEN
jgi:hypothetical protein